jgi:PAS domain S-box-containing protein
MMEDHPSTSQSRGRSTLQQELYEAERASGIGAFVLDLSSQEWAWSPPVAALFGFEAEHAPTAFDKWLEAIFVDDAPKIRKALENTRESGNFYVEFRIKTAAGPLHWLAGKGNAGSGNGRNLLRGTFYDINERKQLEARLLATNETLEARLVELREEAHALDVLNKTGVAVGAELDLERLVQNVTDAGVELSGAQFGAFFNNLIRPDGESYTLYSLSGAPR